MDALDLFAGPGGWDVAARSLGLDPLGIEWDEAACATRLEAGHRTLQGDVAALDPLDFAPCDLLIASPPCQAWSMAGKRGGEADKGLVYELTEYLRSGDFGHNPDIWRWEDERSKLVTEPLRWALQLRPRFIAFEQVPPVLDYWRHVAEILRGEGYGVWTGILEAERYGVPQTRERAILMAEFDGNPHPPAPTHQRYIPGEAARHDVTLEGEILPWVSMAAALGWQEGPSPSPSVTGGGGETGGVEVFAGKGSRARARAAVALVANSQPNAAVRDADEPAPTITGGHDTNNRVWLRAGTNANDVSRPADEPAPTIRYGERMNDVSWVEERPAPTIVTTRRSDQGIVVGRQLPEGEGRNVGGKNWLDRRQGGAPLRSKDEPAHTQSSSGLAKGRDVWVSERPSTAVCADPRISPPGYRGRADDYDADGNLAPGKRSGDNAVRVTETEAAILQGFPPDYPWQGSRTKRFQQIGNAVPPPLARAILGELLALPTPIKE